MFGPTQSNFYWAATTSADAGFPNFACVVAFDVGITLVNNKTSNNYVRAVRGGS